MMVRFEDKCAVGLPPDIAAAWAVLDVLNAGRPYAGILAVVGRVLRARGMGVTR